MSIVWLYLDKKAATINALKDYDSMAYIIEHTDEAIDCIRDKMESPKSAVIAETPSAHNPKAGENNLIYCIDEVDVLKERYHQAQEYMEWFSPAWEALTEEEQFILREFFVSDSSRTEAACNVGERLSLERAQVYRKKDKALAHLSLLLYGKSA